MDNCYMWVCLFLCMFLPLSQEQCFSNTKSSKLLNTLWTAGYDGQFRAPEGLKVRQFSNTEVKVAMQQSMASPISRGVCDGNVHNVVPLTYRVVHDGHGNNKRCIQMYEEENLILYQEVAVASDDARVSDCPDKIAEDNKLGNGLSKIGVPYSNGFDFSGATCGNLPRRVFHATVNQAPGGECGDQSSKVEITDTEVIMDTCASGNSYGGSSITSDTASASMVYGSSASSITHGLSAASVTPGPGSAKITAGPSIASTAPNYGVHTLTQLI